MKLKISTDEENFVTIIADLRTCGHIGLADSIEQAIGSFKKKQAESKTPSHVNPWD